MALSDIIQAINKEADNFIAKLDKDHASNLASLKEDFEMKELALSKTVSTETDQKEADLEKKAKVFANMERRNAFLKAKQEVIDQLSEDFLAEIVNSKDYLDILAGLLKKAATTISAGELIPGKGQKEVLQKVVTNAGLDYKVGDESNQFVGGFRLTSKEADLDFSFEGLIGKKLREATETELAKELFA